MTIKKITIELHGKINHATLEYDRGNIALTVKIPGEPEKTFTDFDYYMCLGKARQDFPHVKFLCKGSKINVYPSRMCSQMANGLVAYEVSWGKAAGRENIVQIFDYEDKDIVTDIKTQFDYHKRWVQSIGENL
ncbi:hypothetical protein HU762_23890 [Pseudomonas sp. SWRI92]|uniref:hypothetical protein n=1 Tax=Pseudomonas sp. SWRI92 TaxID=2745499 RepID=UPI0016459FB0|nr:hypothetical protein [Pseudomonas sp. SWRI92]MBC3376987.1 hypothetical protein [Pseudomonas sp. SWRI92]